MVNCVSEHVSGDVDLRLVGVQEEINQVSSPVLLLEHIGVAGGIVLSFALVDEVLVSELMFVEVFLQKRSGFVESRVILSEGFILEFRGNVMRNVDSCLLTDLDNLAVRVLNFVVLICSIFDVHGIKLIGIWEITKI